MTTYIYKLKLGKSFGLHYYHNQMIEISFYYFNVIICWGEVE